MKKPNLRSNMRLHPTERLKKPNDARLRPRRSFAEVRLSGPPERVFVYANGRAGAHEADEEEVR